MNTLLDDPLAIVTRSDVQPKPADRLSEFKRKAAYAPELYQGIGNHFTKQFQEVEHA